MKPLDERPQISTSGPAPCPRRSKCQQPGAAGPRLRPRDGGLLEATPASRAGVCRTRCDSEPSPEKSAFPGAAACPPARPPEGPSRACAEAACGGRGAGGGTRAPPVGGSAAVAQLVRPSSPSPGALPTPERRSALSAPSPSTGAWDSGLGRHEPRRGPAGAPRGRSGADGAEASGELWGGREAGGRAPQTPGPRGDPRCACAGRWWERRGSAWQGRVREAGDGAECGRAPGTQPGGTAARGP